MNLSPSLAANVVEQSADAMIVADALGTITVWNEAAERLFGFTAAEAVGVTLDLIVPADLRAAHWRGFEHAVRSGRLVRSGTATLTKALHRDRDRIYVTLSFALLRDVDGQVVGAIATARPAPDPHSDTGEVPRSKFAARRVRATGSVQ